MDDDLYLPNEIELASIFGSTDWKNSLTVWFICAASAANTSKKQNKTKQQQLKKEKLF